MCGAYAGLGAFEVVLGVAWWLGAMPTEHSRGNVYGVQCDSLVPGKGGPT